MKQFQKMLVLVSSVLTGVTGVVYFVMDRMMEPETEWAVINHPWEPWVLKAHIIAAPVLVFALGLITTEHIWKHFRGRTRRARRSGLSAMWMIVPMVLSGYLIQAVVQERLLAAVSWTHIVTGVAYLAALGAHQWLLSRPRRVRARNGSTAIDPYDNPAENAATPT